jgi:hypothetical protein
MVGRLPTGARVYVFARISFWKWKCGSAFGNGSVGLQEHLGWRAGKGFRNGNSPEGEGPLYDRPRGRAGFPKFRNAHCS